MNEHAKRIAQALRETLRGEHPGAVDEQKRIVLMSYELAEQIANDLDPLTEPTPVPLEA